MVQYNSDEKEEWVSQNTASENEDSSEKEEEASMDEVLASIRKLIAAEGGQNTQEEELQEQTTPEDDIIELTQEVGIDGRVIDASHPKSERMEQADEEEHENFNEPSQEKSVSDFLKEFSQKETGDETFTLEHQESAENPAEGGACYEKPFEEQMRAQREREEKEAFQDLISEHTKAAALGSFNDLKSHVKHSSDEKNNPLGGGLEGLVLKAMNPLLKKWLDQNLPKVVEKIVREEISKLTK